MSDDGPLFNKYVVKRSDGTDKPGGKHEDCQYFVLDLSHDPFAKNAVRVYAVSCRPTHPILGTALLDLVDKLDG